MNPVVAARFPLVPRPKPHGGPLTARIDALGPLLPPDADHHQQVLRASEVLNGAALVVSDVGLSALARDLCWRHYGIFADALNLSVDVAPLALQPVLNIPRQQIRDGQGEHAYNTLLRLYRAAQRRGVAEVCGRNVNLSAITRGDRHQQICTQLWAAVLCDGARALARVGRWDEAATAMQAHRGVGDRLLDGRQVMILSLLHQGRAQEALDMVDHSTLTQAWERAVAGILRIHCRAQLATPGEHYIDEALSLWFRKTRTVLRSLRFPVR